MKQNNTKSLRQSQRDRSAAIRNAVEFQQLEPRRLMSTTITVNSFADVTHTSGSVISLRDAINDANNVDGAVIVRLPSGTYTLTHGILLIEDESLTIQSVSGIPIISGGGNSEVFGTYGASQVTMTGLTIENGGGVQLGGAIVNAGEMTLNSCIITGNKLLTSNAEGGGIYNGDLLTLNNCTISNNAVGMNVDDTSGLGGGLYNGYQAQLNINNCTITSNTAGAGGGIYNDSGTVGGITIMSSTVSSNSASSQGGGIYNDVSTDGEDPEISSLTAQGVTIINNTSGDEGDGAFGGGGLYDAGTSSLINCTITGNDAYLAAGVGGESGGGGGVYSAGTTSVGNSVIAKNTLTNPSGNTAGIGTDYQGPVIDLGSNVIGIGDDNGTAGLFEDNSDQSGTLASPLNPELTAPVGSPAVEIPIGQSPQSGPPYEFNVISPLLDQGDNTLVTATTDGRGLPRIFNGTVDIGAAEAQLSIALNTNNITIPSDISTSILVGNISDPGGKGPFTYVVDTGEEGGATGSAAAVGPAYATAYFDHTDTGDVFVEDGYGTVFSTLGEVNEPQLYVNVLDQLGTPGLGTSGSYENKGNTIAKATDGDTTTFFDAPTAGTSASNDAWVGLNMGGSGAVITEVAYASRSGFQARMNGGKIQASDDPTFTTGVATLYTISGTPPAGEFTYKTFTNTTAYEYYRYLSPNGSYGNIAELEMFGTSGGVGEQLTGATIGTSGSYKNDGNTIAKATDGNLNTFFDAPTANGNWVGVDLGPTGGTVTAVEFSSRAQFQSRMNGGKIQASNSPTFSTGVVTLYTIGSNANPPAGSLTTASFTNTTAYRYYRYLSPNGSYGNIAELKFFGTPGGLATQLTGTTVGTTGSFTNDGNTIAKATDGNLSTFFDGATANGNWVGLDLGTAQVATEVAYASRAGWQSRMNGGEFQASNNANFSGAVTLYTIGSGSNPASGTLTTAQFSNTTAYRYYRYLSPNGSYGNIAELEFLDTVVAI